MYFSTEPQWQKDLIKEIAKTYGIDIRIVRQMVYYPFLFTKYRIQDGEDWRSIRHRHLGVFTPKKTAMKKLMKQKEKESRKV